MQAICVVIEGHRARRQEKQYSVIFVPHRTVICEHVLDKKGLLDASITLYDYKLDLIPYDTDLLSMEVRAWTRFRTIPDPVLSPLLWPMAVAGFLEPNSLRWTRWQLDYSFRDCYINGDHTTLYFIARSIMKLQSLYGLIPSIKGAVLTPFNADEGCCNAE